MCGIVGFTGREQAAPILLECLKKLEYRGYDSAGIAVRDSSLPVVIEKTTGKLKALSDRTHGGKALKGMSGIGHTRWATHGAPSVQNAHPHVSGGVRSTVTGVHNGIIENYAELKQKLTDNGYEFYSETDTEVLIKLVDYYYRKYRIGPIDAINRTMVRVKGSYAVALMFDDYPEEIYAARNDSPLVIGTTQDSSFLASDVSAILSRTRSFYYLGNLQAARLKKGKVEFFNLNGDRISIRKKTVDWETDSAEKHGYEHFMLKEIHEQPDVIRRMLDRYIEDEGICICDDQLDESFFQDLKQIIIVACGSAWHAGVAAQYMTEAVTDVPVRVELASEFRYRSMYACKECLFIVISQSGETADSLAALRKAKSLGIRTLAIVNVNGSSIANEADHVILTLAGPEISVATTKAYSAQLIALYLLVIQMAFIRGNLDAVMYSQMIGELKELPDKISSILSDKEKYQRLATVFSSRQDMFFIGRNMDYAICLEGSLKMKEISYIHSEAYAAGELKHGTISLIEDGTVVVGVITCPHIADKTLSNMIECKSRGARLITVTDLEDKGIESVCDYMIKIPSVNGLFMASLAVVPLQLLSYYTSLSRGLDVDKPRNLAKSVTVE
ncbi:MAG: glutamine--fructose-6-phosphate transaminase (isomerizing) [Sphaerochaetaceae bacterium]|nr:glutamine--fructose-6-phosphate transaminase (isomerizing) [Sphaerochaetaceae bacterium]